MKRAFDYKRMISLTAVMVMAASQPVLSQGLNVGLGGGTGVSVDVGLGGGTGVSANVGVGGSNVSANVGANVGNTSATASAGVAGAPSSGLGIGACVGLNTGCPASASSTPGPTVTNPGIPSTASLGRGSDSGLSGALDASDFVGLVVMSSDRQVLGIVQSAQAMGDGTVRLNVQISNAIGVSRSSTVMQVRPTRVPTEKIRVGITARQFVSRLS